VCVCAFILIIFESFTLQTELAQTVIEFLKKGQIQQTKEENKQTTTDLQTQHTTDLQQAKHTASCIARALLFLDPESLPATLAPLFETLGQIYSHPYPLPKRINR
jgi:hypothetical protein